MLEVLLEKVDRDLFITFVMGRKASLDVGMVKWHTAVAP